MIIEENKPLKEYNTFGIDVNARYFASFASVGELKEIFGFISRTECKWYILSGGSNTLFVGDYDGLIIHPALRGIRVAESAADHVLVEVAAGEPWDGFVAHAVAQGWGGVENLSLIPGFAGTSVVQNIGAYGVEAGDAVEGVYAYMVETGRVEYLCASSCMFGYRDSVFKHSLAGRAVVTSVVYRLSLNPQFKLGYGDVERKVAQYGGPTLENIRRAIIEIRQSKLPDPKKLGSGGSFFKNPVVGQAKAEALKALHPDMPLYPWHEGCVKLAAGWLIDKAGWRGYRDKDAGVHRDQALVLVNYSTATGAQIAALAQKIIDDIDAKFGIRLHPEVSMVG